MSMRMQAFAIQASAAVILAALFGIRLYENQKAEREGRPQSTRGQLYAAVISPALLPAWIITWMLLPLLFGGGTWNRDAAARIWTLFAHMGVYYALLLAALPLLRKTIRPSVVAMLWLLPTLMYVMAGSPIGEVRAHWVWTIPESLIPILLWIWLGGAAAVLLWYTIGHLCYHRRIVKSGRELTEEEIRQIWERERERANEREHKLLISPIVTTPVSVGLIPEDALVVLPEREYSAEQLRMIFRHELAHLQRNDSVMKFFFCFCTALCWFNPIMWIAMRRAAEDMELSCDETVLRSLEGDRRRDYAELILSTAGEARGFSTCLSASARSLRYRLGQILHSGKKHSGVLLTVLLILAMMLSYGWLDIRIG